MSTTTYRVIFLALGLALVGVVVFAVILTPDSVPTPLPDQVESVSPADGAIVQRQTDLIVDMRVGYGIVLTVNGVRIPDAEIQFTEATGRYRWAPGPTSTFPEWTRGGQAVQIEWDRLTGFADPGSYRWSFTVQ